MEDAMINIKVRDLKHPKRIKHLLSNKAILK